MNLNSKYKSRVSGLLIIIISIFALFDFTYSKDPEFIADEIYVQFSEKLEVSKFGRFKLSLQLESLFTATPISEIIAVFPGSSPDKRLPGMDRVYRMRVKNPANILKTLQRLEESPAVIYAERIPIRRMFEVPNDPLWSSLFHLSLLQVDSARDIHTGDNSVNIAIIDGGVNYLHEDLQQDIWVNSMEDLDGDGLLSPADSNGIDDDVNGFIDDVIGWDFVHIPGQGFVGEDDSLADNDPMDFGGHGTHCAGDAAAVTDNGIGISSVGGNSNVMCIRAGLVTQNGFGYIFYSVEGIYYAVNNGAKVISMSYGSSSPSGTGQIAVDFAHSLGVICVAAAGNDNNNIPQYPANYNHVIAVSATDEQDFKAGFSNYGTWIDVSAPGVNILSTTMGGYGQMDGTSMSTPIVAGLAGLTYAMFPQYTADEIINRILVSCDDIDTLNPSYAGQLGAGRVNAFKTLDKAVRVLSYTILDSASGNNNGRLDYGETASLILTLKNTYQDVTGVTVNIHSLDPILTVMDSVSIFGNMLLGSTSSNAGDPFTFTIGTDTSTSSLTLSIEITTDGNYQYHKELDLPIGQRDILIVNDDQPSSSSQISYYTQALDSLQKSYDIWDTSTQGTPGVNERSYPVIIWYTGEAVQNVLISEEQLFLQNYLDNGGRLFLTGQNIGYDLVEQQNGISFFENYLHANYVMNNSNDYALNGIPGDPIGADQTFIILGSGGANNQNSPDVITTIPFAQTAIFYDSTNQTEQAAVYISGHHSLVYFAFGWEGINDAGEAKRVEVMQRILDWFDQQVNIIGTSNLPVVESITLFPNYPNPFNPVTNINYSLPFKGNVKLTVFDITGREVKTLVNQSQNSGYYSVSFDASDFASGIYIYKLQAGSFEQSRKMILLR